VLQPAGVSPASVMRRSISCSDDPPSFSPHLPVTQSREQDPGREWCPGTVRRTAGEAGQAEATGLVGRRSEAGRDGGEAQMVEDRPNRLRPPVCRVGTGRLDRGQDPHRCHLARTDQWIYLVDLADQARLGQHDVQRRSVLSRRRPRGNPCCVREPRVRLECQPEKSMAFSQAAGMWALTSVRKSKGSETPKFAWCRGWTGFHREASCRWPASPSIRSGVMEAGSGSGRRSSAWSHPPGSPGSRAR